MRFSVIIPAHNEEKYIGKCIKAIRKAEKYAKMRAQIIVSANRCTDKTAVIARKLGAEVCENDAATISGVRNCAAKLAKGDILITIDADSCMSETSLWEIDRMLRSGRYIGGGSNQMFDRWSLGIICSVAYVAIKLMPIMAKEGTYLSGGMFWCYRRDFEKIGGFREDLVSLEDMDFASRLKRLGEKRGKKYGTLKKSKIITSSRKFDQFGDWHLLKDRSLTDAIFTGKDKSAADKYYYNVR